MKDLIKIPNHITLIYREKKNILTAIGPLGKKSIKLKVKILFLKNNRIIKINSPVTSKISNKDKRNLKAIKGTTKAAIKCLIIETTTLLYQKLKIIGVGYRALEPDKNNPDFISLKLGYSHQIYYKKFPNLNIFCLKLTKLFIFGNSFQKVRSEASIIRSFKKPEPYKGKGIIYEYEKIKLKEGKKV